MTAHRMRYPDEVVARTKAEFDLVGAIGKVTRLRKSGRLMSGRCPHPGHRDRNGSFVVNPNSNLYHCYSTSCALSERWFTPIDWMIEFCGASDFNEAMEMLGGKREALSEPVRQRLAEANRKRLQELEAAANAKAMDDRARARAIFAAGIPAKGTLAETYLIEGRGLAGLDVDIPVLRFAPDLTYWAENENKEMVVVHHGPAMLAAFQSRLGVFSAVHMTWLKPDGSGKAEIIFEGEKLVAKKIRGPFMGSAIRLTAGAPTMYMGEGIETTGEVARLNRPGVGAWVAGTLGNLTGRSDPDAPRAPHPDLSGRLLPSIVPDKASLRMAVPTECAREIILADGDTKDLHALRAVLDMACRRIRMEGRAAGQYWPPGRQDLNDYGRALRDQSTKQDLEDSGEATGNG
ncbi:CHC2 zinc finger domain-containing protein [uncultured Cohaesibacter sp.]|uniref:DUF7146 domain-containing protein n=1 Tax=uncultured Cohaesibacter sp. TaxID=1002546 RepID=UPI0029C8D89D|nr:CHC2 zinc finger domain-containing protein [uncultured Cohaesibacter sp.]